MPLPILNESYRPSSNWLQEIVLKREKLDQLAPFDPGQSARIAEHLLTAQVTENLNLSDITITSERVRELLNGGTPINETDQIALRFAQAARHLNSLLNQFSPKAEFPLTAELLRELHVLSLEGIGAQGGMFRTSEGRSLAVGHEPADPEVLPKFIENALSWFSADSFRELHPIEQAWLVHLRFIELQPFEQANGRVVRLIASIFAERADLAPIIISAADRELYNTALISSFQMVTQPGVELMAQSVARALDEMIAIVESTDNR